MLKSRGYDYIINDTRKYYAEAALSTGDFLSSFMFLVVCLLILFVVLTIQFIQRKGAVISKNKAKGESDETKTFNKDMSILLKFDKILTINTNKFNQRLKDLSSIIISFGKLAENYKTEVDAIFAKDQVLKSISGLGGGLLGGFGIKK